jgi:CBS domain containing-hemolysin-like protein
MATNGPIWLLFVFCLTLSFILSGMEAGVFALSRLRVRQQMRAGRASAKVLHGFLEHPENFLWTILVGNTVANFIILGWLINVLQHALNGHWLLFGLLFTLCVFLFYTFFDLLPKMLFRMFPTRLCMLFARPFRLIHLILRPLVRIVEKVSGLLLRWRGGKVFTGHLFGNREELRLLLQESAHGFTSEERAMINRVLDLQSLTVRQAVTPLEQAVTVSAQTPLGEVLALARERRVSWLPAWELRDGKQRIIGLLNINTLLFQLELDPNRPVSGYIKPALYLEEDTRMEIALRRMQRSGQRMAIVLGRGGRETGLLSLQDVLNIIFGEVRL